MKKYKYLIEDLIKRDFEENWFEFKENWFDVDGIGEYISALSNTAKVVGSKYGYLIWGIDNRSHKPVGTAFNYNREVKGEPLEHYLLRNIKPTINFKFIVEEYNGKHLVILEVPCAEKIPTSYKDIRYIRIGSSKESLLRYPEKESELWYALSHQELSIETIESRYQDLSFNSLFNYYSSRGIYLNKKTFEENLCLKTGDGKYNILAQLLSDDSRISIRVAIFAGKTKADPLYSVKDFGFMNLLLSIDKIIDYGDTINILQADERNRIVERKEVSLFNPDAYREAVINAIVHNNWTNSNAPMFTIFSDRIEILSNGGLSPRLPIKDFYNGKSEPINKCLSNILLQLHISEKTGRGVPTIVGIYGKKAFELSNNSIKVTIPFNYINAVNYQINITQNNKLNLENMKLNKTQLAILKEIRNNANITKSALEKKLELGHTAIQNNINILKKNGIIKRIGSDRKGYWEVIE